MPGEIDSSTSPSSSPRPSSHWFEYGDPANRSNGNQGSLVDADPSTQAAPVEPIVHILESMGAGREALPHKQCSCQRFVGRILNGFKIRRLIGVGGMGCVFEAEELALERLVALKLIPPRDDSSVEDTPARFEIETRAIAALEHPAIVRAYNSGVTEGVPYLAMELVRGASLRGVIQRLRRTESATDALDLAAAATRCWEDPASGSGVPDDTRFTRFDGGSSSGVNHRFRTARFREAARIGAEIAEALACAHQNHIIHRDVKPSNILIDLQGRARLSDFGLARFSNRSSRLTQSGTLFGTFRYMSPEQIGGKPVDARTDIYSLGVSLYELVVLRPACPHQQPADVLQSVLNARIVPPRELVPEVPKSLEAVLLKATAKRPADRYQTAAAFAEDLRRFHTGRPVKAKHPSWWWKLREWARNHRLVATTLMLITLAGMALVVQQQRNAQRLRRINASLDAALAREHFLSRDAKASQQQAEHLLYASEIARAYDAWQRGNVNQAALLLDRYHHASDSSYRPDIEWRLLARDLRRSSRDIALSDRPLYTVAFSPDGKYVAVAGEDAKILILDAVSLATIGEIPTRQGEINRLAFSPDSRLLASAGDDGTVCVWHVDTQSRRLQIQAGEERIMDVQFAGRGRWLVSAANEAKSVRIWDAATGDLERVLDENLRGIEGIAVSPDGWQLAVAGWYSKTCWIYDLHFEAPPHVFARTDRFFSMVSWQPTAHGSILAAVTGDGKIFVGPPDRPPLILQPITKRLDDVTIAPGGTELAVSGRQGTVFAFRLSADGSVPVRELGEERLLWSQRLPDGWFAVATSTRIGITSPHNGATTWTRLPRSPDEDGLRGNIAVSPDGNWLVCQGVLFRRDDQQWSHVKVLGAPHNPVVASCFSFDSTDLIVGLRNGTVLVYQLPTLETRLTIPVATAGDAASVTALAVPHDQSVIAVAYGGRLLKLFDYRSGQPHSAYSLPQGDINELAFCDSDRVLLSSPELLAWDWQSGRLELLRKQKSNTHFRLAPLGSSPFALASDPDQRRALLVHSRSFAHNHDFPFPWDGASLVSVDPSGTWVSFTDWKGRLSWIGLKDEGRMVPRHHEWQAHGRRAFSVAFSRHGSTLYSTGEDGHLRTWQQQRVQRKDWPVEAREINQLGLAQLRPFFIAAGLRRCVIVNAETGAKRELNYDPPPTGPDVLAAALDPEANYAAVAGFNRLYIWRADGRPLGSFPLDADIERRSGYTPRQLIFTRQGRQLALIECSRDQTRVRLFSLPSARLTRDVTIDGPSLTATLSEEGNLLAISSPHEVQVRRFPQGNVLATTPTPDCWQLAFANGSDRIIMLDPIDRIAHWDWRTAETAVGWGNVASSARGFTLSPSGRTLVVSDTGGHLTFWQVATGQRFYSKDQGVGPIYQISISDSGWMALRNHDGIWIERWRE